MLRVIAKGFLLRKMTVFEGANIVASIDCPWFFRQLRGATITIGEVKHKVHRKGVWKTPTFIFDNGEVLARIEKVDNNLAHSSFIIEYGERRYSLAGKLDASWEFVLREVDSTMVGIMYPEDTSDLARLLQTFYANLPEELPLAVRIFLVFVARRTLQDYVLEVYERSLIVPLP